MIEPKAGMVFRANKTYETDQNTTGTPSYFIGIRFKVIEPRGAIGWWSCELMEDTFGRGKGERYPMHISEMLELIKPTNYGEEND